jgi:hypothetical protein
MPRVPVYHGFLKEAPVCQGCLEGAGLRCIDQSKQSNQFLIFFFPLLCMSRDLVHHGFLKGAPVCQGSLEGVGVRCTDQSKQANRDRVPTHAKKSTGWFIKTKQEEQYLNS